MEGSVRPSLAAEWIWKLLSMSGAPEVDESLLYDCAPGILPARTSEPWNCAFGPSVQMAEPLLREVWARFVGCYPPSILTFAKKKHFTSIFRCFCRDLGIVRLVNKQLAFSLGFSQPCEVVHATWRLLFQPCPFHRLKTCPE